MEVEVWNLSSNRIQIVRKLPTVSLFKCFTARALFPNSKSSRAILWRELLCLLQTDIKTPHWALRISPMSSSMMWEMWTSQIRWRQRTQRMKMFRAFSTLMAPEKAWASIVTTDGKYLVNNIIIIQQVLDTCAWSDPLGAFSLNNTKKSTCIITNIWRCHTDSSSLDIMLCSNLLPAVLLAYCQSEDIAFWLLKHPILAALQSLLSSCISLFFEQLFWKLQHSPDQHQLYCKLLPRRLRPNTNIVSGWHFSCTINKLLRNN